MKFIEISAKTNYDLGLKIGKKTKKEIQKIIKKASFIHESNKKFNSVYKKLLKIAKKEFPQYVEEIKGMSEGSNVPFDKIMKFNLPELIKYKTKKGNVENYDNCTTLVLKDSKNSIIAHNEDEAHYQDVYVLKATLPSKTKVLTLASYGCLIGNTANLTSNNLFYSCNALNCKDERIGISKRFITRFVLEAKNIEDFLRKATLKKRAQGQNYIIAYKNKVFNLEVSAKKHILYEIKNNFTHTNNYIFKKMLKIEARKNKNEGTFLRYKLAKEKIKQVKNIINLKKILSNHENRPSCICAHGKAKKDFNLTVGCIIFKNKKKNSLKIGYGPTCKAKFKEYFI